MSVAPRFTKKPSLRQEGSAVVFSCEMEADPEPSISWYRGEMPLQADQRTSFKIEPVSAGSIAYVLSLVIQDAGPQDSDTYRVEAINQHGQMTANANLNLQGLHTLHSHTSYIHYILVPPTFTHSILLIGKTKKVRVPADGAATWNSSIEIWKIRKIT